MIYVEFQDATSQAPNPPEEWRPIKGSLEAIARLTQADPTTSKTTRSVRPTGTPWRWGR